MTISSDIQKYRTLVQFNPERAKEASKVDRDKHIFTKVNNLWIIRMWLLCEKM